MRECKWMTHYDEKWVRPVSVPAIGTVNARHRARPAVRQAPLGPYGWKAPVYLDVPVCADCATNDLQYVKEV
jgi:hypothetical protein